MPGRKFLLLSVKVKANFAKMAMMVIVSFAEELNYKLIIAYVVHARTISIVSINLRINQSQLYGQILMILLTPLGLMLKG